MAGQQAINDRPFTVDVDDGAIQLVIVERLPVLHQRFERLQAPSEFDRRAGEGGDGLRDGKAFLFGRWLLSPRLREIRIGVDAVFDLRSGDGSAFSGCGWAWIAWIGGGWKVGGWTLEPFHVGLFALAHQQEGVCCR